ncbi:MAG: SMC-Scp complex subunit ScpB [Gammaproteobacteria bacterium]|nr:SMC-Scp complex subunit ScpB [Gammaproteobacteria bacterium]
MISDALLEQIIEGALLASGQTLSVDRIQSLFDEGLEPEKQRIQIVLERIGEKCENKGYELKKVATGYRFQVKQDLGKWVSRLWEEKPQRYSRALLETLAIIAYRQPVTRGEIEDIRGVAVSSHITKTLVEREWIQVVGHRDVPGRPAMYATTKMFLDYFNLETLEQLPTLEEIQEIADANHALELEDKAEEGNFDFASHQEELGDSENLLSAAQDMAEAEALVQQVEDALFNKPAEEDEESAVDQGELLDAEQQIAELDDQLAESEQAMPQGLSEDASEEEIAEATIARMIAEQEKLLKEKDSFTEQAPSVFSDSSDAVIEENTLPEETEHNEPDALKISTENDSVLPESSEDEEAALLAAMEEEMIAQLQAEQDELEASRDEEEGEKSLSDLANKFN